MDDCALRFCPLGQIHTENMSDTKPRFLQVGSTVSRAEVVCPQPRRATNVPFVLDSLTRFVPKAKSTLSVRKEDHGLKLWDVILTKDELDYDSDAGAQVGFLCGSPPVRTNNPVVHDAEFTKLTLLSASPRGGCHGMKPQRRDKGSPSYGSPLGASPKVRIEGFACGSPESNWIVPTFA
ncbi:uncharacterized protein LOC109825208 [Asparagus officinalis]|uniref:uncharacterized protein LOC109825208 n=1 Tax=Asparagus officinalis TaxID=4686 RepID=UPI00098E11FF|nr:uncharacterized protein LOC109825208 [Asparagus officinalis]XP_020247581.1 uncharacterized protein LOC109825208 [Asparagus officinalis]XP_020247582.1 uncharacterized protein LOC109825208 [Asparagus officinalis]XP_020247583.1 uncharacterized protein LOC109825208 [Asparagus officinalis]